MRKRIITWKRAIICLIAIVLIGFGLLVAWSLLISSPCSPESDRVEIDNFIGRQIEMILDDDYYRNLYDFIVVYEETDVHPAGIIIRQNPAAGRTVPASQDGVALVHLYVATTLSANTPRAEDSEYERLRVPIPSSLHESFEYLNELLSLEDIEWIKNSELDDLISLHFSLGMWMRNHWLNQPNSGIADELLDMGFTHLDNMSQFIIEAYHHYLNGADYETQKPW